MLEIEIKAYCEDLNELEKKIVSLGGKYQTKTDEKDIYYKHPSRDFARTDEAFRIRMKGDACMLTYKGPKMGGKAKTRIEEEVRISDFGLMKKILKNLGFEPVAEVVKRRTAYRLDDCEICLDSVAGLGDFVEIEKMGEDPEKNEKEVFALAGKLGLSNFEKKSYLEMILGKRAT